MNSLTVLLTISILISASIISGICFFYYYISSREKEQIIPSSFSILVEDTIQTIEDFINLITTKRSNFITSYVIYLLFYISIGNWLELFFLPSPFSFFEITFSLALVTFFGSWFFSIRKNKLKIFLKFLNPIALITHILPFFFLAVRLFLNVIFGVVGRLVLNFLLLILLSNLSPFFSLSLPFFVFFSLILKIYFDLFDGFLQALIFSLLTLVFWEIERR